MRKKFLSGLVIIAAFAAIAQAFRQPNETVPKSVSNLSKTSPKAHFDNIGVRVVQKKAVSEQTLAQSKSWRNFAGKAGHWLVHWNKATRTPHLAAGTPLPLVTYPLTQDNIEAACTDFILSHQDLLGAKAGDLRKIQTLKAGGRWHAAFEQTHNGVPVLGGSIRMAFTKDDRLVAFGSDVYPDVDVNTTPNISESKALEIAVADCNQIAGDDDRISDLQLYVVPVSRGSAFDYVLCWRFEILQREVQKKWQYLIDAHSGKIISKVNTLWYAYVSGLVRGEYKPEYAHDQTAVGAFPHEEVIVEGPEQPIKVWDFDTDPGWTTQGGWAFGKPTGSGSYCGDPCSGYTGSNVYGYNLFGDYSNNMMSPEYLITTPINCSKQRNVRLKFKRWLGVESSAYDQAFIDASNDGKLWVRIWNNVGPAICDGRWIPVSYDISTVADLQPRVFIRWGMGLTNGADTYPGWNIDDVEIVSVQGGINRDVTDESGAYRIKQPRNPSTVISYLSGQYVDVKYIDGLDPRFERLADFGNRAVNWMWDKTLYNFIDETNVYRHINYIHDYYKILDKDFSGLDYPVSAQVYGDFSNAYWDGYGIVFGRGDGVNFDDFALYSEVIYHEYTHGVTDKIYRGFELPYVGESGAMNEGWSDFFAVALTPSQSPLIGEGGLLINESSGFRSLNNTYRRETDWANEVHDDSQMFSGSLWEARNALGANLMEELAHFALYDHATNFEDYLIALLIEDDTQYGDGDLSNGTPHAQAVYTAFGNHGIGGIEYLAPSIVISDDSGNHDGKLDPGETAKLSLTLTNGWADATNVRAVLATFDPCVTITKPGAAFSDMAFGDTADNASDEFVISVSSACPQTHTIRFTLTVTADNARKSMYSYKYSRNCLLYYDVAVSQLAYDDGEADAIVPSRGFFNTIAVKVTPDKYPSYPAHIKIFPYATTTIRITVWDDNGPGGTPGAVLGSVDTHPQTVDDWYDVDISQLGLVIDSGSVYVGWVDNGGLYGNGIDFDPPYYQRSWAFDGHSWYPLETYGLLGNFMIRLQYANRPPLRINPPFEYTSYFSQPVSDCLSAVNGTPPYHDWQALPQLDNYRYDILASIFFAPVGAPQNVHDDDAMFTYNLPFTFTFYGVNYTSVNICTNGFLDFVNTVPIYINSDQQLIDEVCIAPYWADLTTFAPDDVYIDESVAGQVMIRWQATGYWFLEPASFAVVLFNDGSIRFDYGSGNIFTFFTPTVGISAGNGERYTLVPGYNDVGSLPNAASVLFTPVPAHPSLPPGVSLDPSSGCLSGIPNTEGSYAATIVVTDSSPQPQTAKQQMIFTVLPAQN